MRRELSIARRAAARAEKPESSSPEPGTEDSTAQEADVPEQEVIRLSGTLAGVAEYRPQTGTWVWSRGLLNPDLGQRADAAPLTLAACWVDTKTGMVSVSVGEMLEVDSVQFRAVTATSDDASGHSRSARVVERFDGPETGLSAREQMGGMSGVASAMVRARDMIADARRLNTASETSPTVVAQSTFRFSVRGAKYTLHVRVTFAPDGSVSAVEFFDGT